MTESALNRVESSTQNFAPRMTRADENQSQLTPDNSSNVPSGENYGTLIIPNTLKALKPGNITTAKGIQDAFLLSRNFSYRRNQI